MPFTNPHPLYATWCGMIGRCRNKNLKQWHQYGGRGITVCAHWKLPAIGFHNFVTDMGERPLGFTLDRINNDGNYQPDNCRWASRIEQQSNRSITKRFVIDGTEYLLMDLARTSGLKPDTVELRIKKGMTFNEIINPIKQHNLSGLALGGLANGARQKSKSHCPQGHEYSESNTYFSALRHRTCKICRALRETVRRNQIANP